MYQHMHLRKPGEKIPTEYHNYFCACGFYHSEPVRMWGSRCESMSVDFPFLCNLVCRSRGLLDDLKMCIAATVEAKSEMCLCC